MAQNKKRIRIKTNFVGSDFEIEVPTQYSVRDILYSIMPEFVKDSRIDEEIREEWEILVNEKDIWFYPDNLETQLKTGDLLEVYLTPLGGG
ncbi:MAG TPA: hypothetical protein PLM71_01550 [Syntrophorhabdaceae bacterium]|nr:hypothetical protein [Syntrophorhabdaceae bacterium]